MQLYSLYYTTVEGKIADFSCFQVFSGEGIDTGFFATTGADDVATQVAFAGFPEAPETEYNIVFTVKAENSAIPSAEITVKGISEKQAEIARTGTTDADGAATISLPAGSYTYTIKDTVVGSAPNEKTYTMKSADKNGVSLTVDSTTTKADYVSMEELTAAYPIRIKAENAAGDVVSLKDAALKFGSVNVNTSGVTGGEVSFTTASSLTQSLQLSGVKGYQNIVEGTAAITVTPTGQNEAKLFVGDVTGAAADISVESDAAGQYIRLVLQKTVTDVTIPLPVPQADGKNITVEQARGMTLNFMPVKGSAADLVAEVGAGGLTVSGSAITVTADAAEAALAGAISAKAALPDGAYGMSIGGSGFDPAVVPVTVLTDYTTNPYTRVVNVGGVPTLGENGTIAEVAGGATGSTANVDAGGNGSIDLSGGAADTTVMDGGSTTVAPDTGKVTLPSTATGGTDISAGGVLDSETAKNDMTPTVVTDPLYDVDVTMDKDADNGGVVSFTAKVYLKNAAASSGTFGLYVDPVILSSGEEIAVALANGLRYNPAVHGTANKPELKKNYDGCGYVFFAWDVGQGGSVKPLDATAARQLVATITLPVDAKYKLESELLKVVDNRTFYAMDYTRTESGKRLSTENADDPEALAEAMGSFWRTTDNTTGASGSVHLDDDKATRGGFYQFSAPDADGVLDVSHDIRMQFNLPENIVQQRADFWVTEPDGAAVGGAVIAVYSEPYDPKTEPAAEALLTVTTDAGGYAHAPLTADKTYYYTVEEAGHWAYPDGTALTDADGLTCDSFLMTEKGASPKTNIVQQGDAKVPTAVVNGYVNPRMEPTTYHSVAVTGKADDGTDTTPKASITSPAMAYNYVRYYFSLEPNAGYEWKLAENETMVQVAGDLDASLHGVNASAGTEDAFRGGVLKSPKVHWDGDKEQFFIEGTDIDGASIGANEHELDALRAGDLVIVVPEKRIQPASYVITATPGKGGMVKRELDAAQTAENSTAAASGYVSNALEETLSNGRTVSSIYTFKPDAGNTIGRVVVNGAVIGITEEEKKTAFTYQFTNVSADQHIYVTFLDKDGNELSDPFVTVTLGAKGKAALSNGEPNTLDPADLTGAASASYVLAVNSSFTAALTPDEGYEIDTVLVDGEPRDKSAAGVEEEGKTYYTGTLTIDDLSLAAGATRTIVATFKPKGAPSTQAIVTASVARGSGTLAPVGVNIYPVGSTPTYALQPMEGWTVGAKSGDKSVLLDGADKSASIRAADKGFTYTLPALAGNVTLEAAFAERAYPVEGKILIQAVRSDKAEVAPATLTFVRPAVAGKTDKTVIEVPSSAIVAASGERKLLSFSCDIPAGTWTVTVSKQGYLDYVVSEFKVAEDAAHTIYFGDAACQDGKAAGSLENARPVPLIAGDAAGEGLAVAFNDASMVVAGWLENALPANKRMGDVNESNFASGGGSDVDDMGIVQHNMYQKRVKIQYADYCTPAAPAV